MATYTASLNARAPFVRANGIRDASGLSTSELGRFTSLERDRGCTSVSVSRNRLYPLFDSTLVADLLADPSDPTTRISNGRANSYASILEASSSSVRENSRIDVKPRLHLERHHDALLHDSHRALYSFIFSRSYPNALVNMTTRSRHRGNEESRGIEPAGRKARGTGKRREGSGW